ncbi:MAG: GNAT family N-acetyltransferase [Leptolyngbya sp. SIO3F4]|nr:GNAT family N-acetyltransferase [Leptolyngbya sp. SIO3F4]
MHSITIRQAQLNDAEEIAYFNQAMALETENKKLAPEVILAGVKALLANPSYGFYIVAEAESQVVACLMITTEWSDWRNGVFWWIQSVFVKPDYRRRGIYRRMYTFIKQMANDSSNVCGFRLYVEKDNTRAQQTYASMGMMQSPYRIFEELKTQE